MSDHATTAMVEPLAVPGWLAFRSLGARQAANSTPSASLWQRMRRMRPSRARRAPDAGRVASYGPDFSPSQHRGHQMLLLDDRTVIGHPAGRACASRRSM